MARLTWKHEGVAYKARTPRGFYIVDMSHYDTSWTAFYYSRVDGIREVGNARNKQAAFDACNRFEDRISQSCAAAS